MIIEKPNIIETAYPDSVINETLITDVAISYAHEQLKKLIGDELFNKIDSNPGSYEIEEIFGPFIAFQIKRILFAEQLIADESITTPEDMIIYSEICTTLDFYKALVTNHCKKNYLSDYQPPEIALNTGFLIKKQSDVKIE